MDVEQILNLFDSFWFERGIFNKPPFSSNPQRENQENPLENSLPPPPPPEVLPRIHTRSISEDLSSKLSFMSNSNSPDSILFSPKLRTIFSGKEIAGTGTESPENSGEEIRPEFETESRKRNRGRGRGRRRRRPESKSLSELEFEELKGFMDLGFVFSEEDKDSSLASIIPGLNRLKKKEHEEKEEEEEEEKGEISRPYLSEAWEAMEKEKELKKPPLMEWRFPALGNEIDMKDNLKWWAHTVASTVR